MAVKRILAIMAVSVSAVVLSAAPTELRVKGDRVNLRARPIGDSEVAGQVSTGDILFAPEGFQSGAEWVKVRPPASVDVWIYASLLTADEVNASDSYVRCGPGSNYKFVGKLDKGDKIVKRGNPVGDWQPIAPIASKCELFISSDYVETVVPPKPTPPSQPLPPPPPNLQTSKPLNPEASKLPPPAQPLSSQPLPPPPPNLQASKPLNPEASKLPPPAQPLPSQPLPPPPPNLQASKPLNPEASKLPPPVQPLSSQPLPPPGLQTSKPQKPEASKLPPPVQPVPAQPLPPPPPALPPELANLALDELQPQGHSIVYSGRLEKIPSMRAAGSTRYQLVAKTGVMKSAVMCRLSGLTGQWRELLDSDIEVTGRLWYLSGDPVPVLHATRVIRVASWEE